MIVEGFIDASSNFIQIQSKRIKWKNDDVNRSIKTQAIIKWYQIEKVIF